eukprot:m.70192 g.70192  ORF g.70192 m.70192 type:complete len:697 (+) comp11661_c1_seq1:123-2213(+)
MDSDSSVNISVNDDIVSNTAAIAEVDNKEKAQRGKVKDEKGNQTTCEFAVTVSENGSDADDDESRLDWNYNEFAIEEKVREAFHVAFDSLKCSVQPESEMQLAKLICNVMGNKNRVYHRTPHVFDLFTSAETEPLSCLAAMFHDTVYLSVDNGLEAEAMGLLRDAGVDFVGEENGAHGQPLVLFKIVENILENGDGNANGANKRILPTNSDEETMEEARKTNPAQSLAVTVCCSVFAWDPTKLLKTGDLGVNEFLSAVLAFQSLTPYLTFKQLFQIVVCIEATIPFRHTTVYSDLLHRATITAKELPGLDDITETQLVKHVARACILAERDVGNFASTDSRYFLEKAWMLLPEINLSLRHPSQYSILDYGRAMLGMVKFYEFLLPTPDRVFPQMDAARSAAEHQRLISLTTRNLNIGIEFCRTKFVTACILDALVNDVAGGDASLHVPAAIYCGKGGGIDLLSHAKDTPRSSSLQSMSSSKDDLFAQTMPSRGSRRATSIQPTNLYFGDNTNNGDISSKDLETYSSFALMELATHSKPVTNASSSSIRTKRRSSIPEPFSSHSPRGSAYQLVSSDSFPSSRLSTISEYFYVDLLVSAHDYVDAILFNGSGYTSAFDKARDLTSHHIHHTLGKESGLKDAYDLCLEYLAGDIDLSDFLDQFTDEVVEPLRQSLPNLRDNTDAKKRSKSSGAIFLSFK